MILAPVTEERVSRFVDNPDNARKLLDLESLLPSIERDGVLQPVGAVLDGDSLRLVWGHRRLGCARMLGMETVPVRVFRENILPGDTQRLALVENLQRKDLLPSEEAAAFKSYMEAEELTATELAALLGMSDAKVSKKLACLKLSPALLALIDGGKIPETSAPDLAKLDEAAQRDLAGTITGHVTRDELARAIGKPRKGGRKAEKLYRLQRGGLSLLSTSNDLDTLLDELDELRKAIKSAKEKSWDFPTLARVLRVSVSA